MNLLNGLFQFLVSLAVLSSVVLAVGALILRFLKQPIERIRCIQFTFAALALAVVLQQATILPKLSLPVLPARVEVMSLPFDEDQRLPSAASKMNHTNSNPIIAVENAEPASPQFAPPSSSAVAPVAPSIAPEAAEPLTVARVGTVSCWSVAKSVLTVSYVFVSATFTLLIIVGFYRLHLLRQRSRSLDLSMLEQWKHVGAAIRKRKVRIVASNDISVPIAFGVISPTIAIPRGMVTQDETDSLFYCLSHEWAHIKSRDVTSWWFVQFLQPVLWFQPFYWSLQRELRMAQDQLADAFAAGGSDDRTAYAQLLTDMACARQGVPFGLAVSMAGRRSNLYRRIECLLMSRFTLASRSRRWVAVLTAGCLVIIGTVLGVAQLSPVAIADDQQGPSPNSLSSSDDGANSKPLGELKYKSHSGHVTDEDGKPIANATLWASTTYHLDNARQPDVVTKNVGTTNAEGAFHFEIDESWMRGFRLEDGNSYGESLSQLSIIAQADGYGLSGFPMAAFADGLPPSDIEGLRNQVNEAFGEGSFEQRTIRVPALSNVIKGRVLDLQGDPIANVSVTLEEIESPNIAHLLSALEKEDSDAANAARYERWCAYGAVVAAHLLAESQPVILTNARGEFELRGLGKDQLAILTLTSQRHEATRIHVLGREMNAMLIPHISFFPKGAQDVYYGTSFSQVLGPSIPVLGTVTEYQSGKPIADAVVYVERLFSEQGMSENNLLRMRTQYMRTTTDEQGRYTLRGLPPGGEHVIEVVPPKTEPWLISSNTLSLAADDDAHQLDVKVFRGIWIEGNLTDGDTKEPLDGRVDYLALSLNPNIPQEFGLKDGWEMGRFPVDKSGHFRVAGLPGPGLLLARAYGKKQYPLAVGAEESEGYDADSKYLPTTPIGMPLTNWNRVQRIDPSKDAKAYYYDLSLKAGNSVVGRVESPRELKEFELEALGLHDEMFWSSLKDSTFTVQNYEVDKPRRLFVRTKDRSLVGTLLVEGHSPSDLVLKLQPSVTITGRLIETETDETAVGYGIHCSQSTYGYFRIEDNSNNAMTDEDGRFEISGLLAGIEYSMSSFNVQRFSSGKNDFTVDLTDATPGSKIDLGDVTGKSAKKN